MGLLIVQRLEPDLDEREQEILLRSLPLNITHEQGFQIGRRVCDLKILSRDVQ